MTIVTTLYFSGYGHTAKQADAVHDGVKSIEDVQAELIRIDENGEIQDNDWQILEKSDAIIFGSPTYMGGPAWQFKKIADASSKPWLKQSWKDKLSAGFTNSSSMNGDKGSTLNYFITLAMQHSMLWIGTGLLPANKKDSTPEDVNYMGGFTGAMAQSPMDATPEEAPQRGDLETAGLLGKRVAKQAKLIAA